MIVYLSYVLDANEGGKCMKLSWQLQERLDVRI